MENVHLDAMHTHIISMICHESNDKALSADTLKNAVLHSREDIRNGRVVTIEEMRRKHPRI